MNAQQIRDKVELIANNRAEAEATILEIDGTQRRPGGTADLAFLKLKAEAVKTIAECDRDLKNLDAELVKAEQREAREAEEKAARRVLVQKIMDKTEVDLRKAGLKIEQHSEQVFGRTRNFVSVVLPNGTEARCDVESYQKSDGWRCYGPETLRIALSFDFRLADYGYKTTHYAALDKSGKPTVSKKLIERIQSAKDMLIAQAENSKKAENMRKSELAKVREILPGGMTAEEVTEDHYRPNARTYGRGDYYTTRKIVIKVGDQTIGTASHKDGKFRLHISLTVEDQPAEQATDNLDKVINFLIGEGK